MAEIVGTIASAITLAGLFKLCIEAFDVVHTAKNQDMDLKKLTLKLNIEKCRLWTWGQAMGLTQSLPPGSSKPLDNCPFPAVVEESLGFIVGLFNNSEALKSKYGCRELQQADVSDASLLLPGVSGPDPIKRLSMSFDDFRVRNLSKMKQAKLVQKGSWVIRDRKKFELLISEAKNLIDGLQDITKDVASLAGQERIMRSRITTINDVETLDMVAEVCEKDHPRFSDAASTRADAISLSTTFQRNVSDWANTVEDSDSDTETVDAIESWTTTEMKHKLFSLLKKRHDRAVQQEGADDVHKRSTIYSEDITDLERSEQILQDMAATRFNADFKDFKEELTAIEQWFRVLDDSEKAYSYYTLAQLLPERLITFFFIIFQYKAQLASEQRESKTEISKDL